MSEKPKTDALDEKQLETISGGLAYQESKAKCTHPSCAIELLGNCKEENGVKYVDIRCNLCDFTGWVKMSDLIAPAK